MDDVELGRRIAYWRERRGMTQQLFADRIARSKSWVEKAEAGTRSAGKLSVLEDICEVLRVDMAVLMSASPARATEQCLGNLDAEAIRGALERYAEVAAGPAADASAEPPSLEALRRQVDYLWQSMLMADYGVAGKALPEALTAGQRAHAAYGNPESARLLAEAYQVTSSVACKLGEFDLGWIAADRSIALAEESGDRLLTASGGWRIANALKCMGRPAAAYDVNVSFAGRVEADLATKEAQAVYGMLLLQAAIAAARKGDNREVRSLIREAQEIADRVGPGRNDYYSSFGPANVAIHRVAGYVELGEGGTGIEAVKLLPMEEYSRLHRTRRGTHLVDLARGYLQWGRLDEALTTMLEAEQVAPAEVRCGPTAHAAITDLVQRTRGPVPLLLRDLATRAGVAS